MANRYEYFTDGDLRSAVRQVEEAKDVANAILLQWQDKMKQQLVADILETLANLKYDKDEEEYQWRASAVLKFLVGDFASGLLYATEKLR